MKTVFCNEFGRKIEVFNVRIEAGPLPGAVEFDGHFIDTEDDIDDESKHWIAEWYAEDLIELAIKGY